MIRLRSFRPRPGAFTLVELLVVILIIGILLALLVPAIVGAMRTAKNASVTSEIQAMGASLNQFKLTYGDFPPSRVYLHEGGYMPIADNTPLASVGSDITLGTLAQRSIRMMQKFWPRVQWNTTTNNPTGLPWAYDFNGSGAYELTPSGMGLYGGYVLRGHQCLTFFLGGVPYNTGSGIGMTGFGKNPINPFTNSVPGNALYRGANPSSTQPLFEFRGARLSFDPNDPTNSMIPAYVDSIGSVPTAAGSPISFYAYFSSYGGAYDPNDVNFSEADNNGNSLALSTVVSFNCIPAGGGSGSHLCVSPSPNPYTTSFAVPASNGTAVFQAPSTFQIISSGNDGIFGLGGQWTNQGQNTLPFEVLADNSQDKTIRKVEEDNLSNFNTGKLGN